MLFTMFFTNSYNFSPKIVCSLHLLLFSTLQIHLSSILYQLPLVDAFYRQTLTAVRSLEFSDIKPGKYLTGSLIKTQYGISKRQCSLKCASLSSCRSFNFCGRQTCELNRSDVFSIGIKNQHLLRENIKCQYYGMARNYIPDCKEKGIIKYIQAENPGVCQINQKRVDRKWSSWQAKSNKTGQELVEYNWREILVDFAHGGIMGETHSIEVTTHVILVPQLKSWFQSQNNCRQLGGHLFCNLDGSSAQLASLASLLGQKFWLGLELKSGTYHKVTEGTIPRIGIPFIPGEPGQNGEVHLYSEMNGQVGDIPSNVGLASICDMI